MSLSNVAIKHDFAQSDQLLLDTGKGVVGPGAKRVRIKWISALVSSSASGAYSAYLAITDSAGTEQLAWFPIADTGCASGDALGKTFLLDQVFESSLHDGKILLKINIVSNCTAASISCGWDPA